MTKTIKALLVATVSVTLIAFVTGTTASPMSAASYTMGKVDANDLSFYRPSDTTAPYPQASDAKVRNVIFCIGDGMGLSQVTLARVKATGLGGKLYLERLPVTGLVHTHAANSSVTDSAAAGTALACGIKTRNAMIGMDPEEQSYCTIIEAAQARGMATGLVVTSTITHATPASFAAHVKSRKMEDKIAEQLLAHKVNVLFGGGRRFFQPQSVRKSGRKDDIDLLAMAKEMGYQYISKADELASLQGTYALGLFQPEGLTTAPPEPDLAALTRKAMELLGQVKSDPTDQAAGFFLMVEGSQIDWACHDNDAKGAIRQTLLFDQAVQAAVDFALRDGQTLVLVTADHETGGLTLIGGGNEDKPDTDLTVRWSTKGHSGSPVPIYALGPGASSFAGVQDNTEIPRKIARLLDIRPFPRPSK